MLESLRKKLFICLICMCFFGVINVLGQKPKVTTFINVTPNRFAPEFYAEDLSVKATLVNLPGADTAGSTWTLSYEVYFLPEGQVGELAAKRGGRLGSETSVSDFPKRIFLGKAGFTKKNLKTLADRTVISEKFKFRSKIPVSLQMENANIITAYTIKVYDAKLKKTLVRNRIFYGRIFIGDKQKRSKVYLSFYIPPSGEINDSQLEKEDNSTKW